MHHNQRIFLVITVIKLYFKRPCNKRVIEVLAKREPRLRGLVPSLLPFAAKGIYVARQPGCSCRPRAPSRLLLGDTSLCSTVHAVEIASALGLVSKNNKRAPACMKLGLAFPIRKGMNSYMTTSVSWLAEKGKRRAYLIVNSKPVPNGTQQNGVIIRQLFFSFSFLKCMKTARFLLLLLFETKKDRQCGRT